MATQSVNYSNSANGWDVTIYWECEYGDSTAYMWWEVNENSYSRTFNVVERYATDNRYNSGSYLTVGSEYYLYIYKNGSYSQQAGPFTITAPDPPDHFFWYFAGDHGSDPDPNYQIWTHGSTATLMSALPNVAGTTYTVSYNANGGSSTPSSSSSTYTYTHTYWNDDYGDNYSPGAKFYNVTEGNSFTAVWSGSRKAVTLASAITKANTTATRTVTFDANGGTCSTTSLNSTATVTHTFSKWAAGSTSGTQYSAGASFTPSANTTMYAIWTSTTGTYSAITLPTPTRTGYDFKGWSTSSTATSGSTGSYTPTATQTLYATWTEKTYPVTYYANGHGTAPAAQTKIYNTDLTLQAFIANNTSTGYTVSYNANGGNSTPSTSAATTLTHRQTYWNTNSSGTGTNYASKASYTENAKLDLYAIWSTTSSAVTLASAITRADTKETGYKVTFDANGGTCSTVSLTSEKIRSYKFNKWAKGSVSGTTYNAGIPFMPSSNTTMYATWTESVTNGSIILPMPSRTGYTFKGWATSSSATSGTAAGESYSPNMATTLYATWQADTWTVQYNANGYGTAPSSQTKTYGTPLTLRPFISDQIITGYTVSFNKNGGSTTPSAITSELTKKQTYWNTNSSGTGTNYSSSGTYNDDKAATLYAIWGTTVNGSITLPGAIARASDSVNYTISYNANGGTSAPSNQTITRITPYSFNKWAEGSVSGTKYDANATYTPTAAKTMYATWTTGATTGTVTLQSGITKNDTTATGYKVTFNANGGSCSTTSLNATDTVKWTFSKWNTKSDGTGTDYSPNTAYSFDANTSLYAKWTSSTTKGSITLPTPTRNGYTFQGWSTNQNATSGTKGQYTPSGNVTLYAIWSIDNSIIHYNNNGVDVPCVVYYNNNGTAVLCNVYYNNNGTLVQI